MNHELTVSESVDIKATLQQVWEVLTNPTLIKEYLYGTETITDWKVGSEIIFQGEYEGHKYRYKGVILENQPTQLLRYSYWSGFSGLEEKPENFSQVEYALVSKSAKMTQLTWTQKGYPDADRQAHSKKGMPTLLNSIKVIAERT